MSNNVKLIRVVSWNVRGLGESDKCTNVRDALSSLTPSILCIQETKLATLDRFKACTFLPAGFTSIERIDADGSRGGILTAWNPAAFTITAATRSTYALTVTLASTHTDLEFTLTNVYAPADHRHTTAFLDELHALSLSFQGPWTIVGDFNLVCGAEDKSNAYLNHSLCSAFNSAIDAMALLELPLLDRLFTWSNKCANPILARLDRAFFNN
ncbi:hypothetical protein EJB05_34879, partial [Eragrostis curvula]